MLSRFYLSVCILFFLVVPSGVSHAANYYSDGVTAYINKDYAKAQSQWLQSAKQGDAKSMFNLGLLHEQGRIDNVDQSKASEWYRLAGNAGYLPANYHLALMLLGLDVEANKDKALLLMKKSADKGFKPAVDYLNKGKVINTSARNKTVSSKNKLSSKDLLTQQAKPHIGGESATQVYLTEAWVEAKRSGYWTIQMLAFKNELNVQAFIDQHKLRTKAAYFKERVGDQVFYKLIYGAYKTKIQADFARQNLDKQLAQHGPWLRTIDSVQTVIKAQ